MNLNNEMYRKYVFGYLYFDLMPLDLFYLYANKIWFSICSHWNFF